MMNFRILLSLCLLLCCYTFSLESYSQNIKIITLEECIKIASDSSLQAFVSEHSYNSSYWEFESYKARRLPALDLNMSPFKYNRNFIQRYDYENNMDVYRRQQSLQSYGSLSLSQNFDLTGGTFFIDSELGYTENRGIRKANQFTSIPIRIGYSQKLFGFNSFKWERKIEPLKFEKAKKMFLYRQQEIAENTVLHFFNLALVQKEYEIGLENKLIADTLYYIGLERQKISTISQADILTLELDRINIKNKLKSLELKLNEYQSGLSVFLNLPEVVFFVMPPKETVDIIFPIEKALQLARDNHPNYFLFKQQILEAERELDMNKKSALLDASISASIGFNQVADNFGDVYKRPLQQDVFSISLSIPILDWGTRKGKVNMAKSNLNLVKLSTLQSEQKLTQDVTACVQAFHLQQEQLESMQEAINIAKESCIINKDRFIVGKIDINTLNLSLNRYKDAQYNYLSTLFNYWINYYKIRKLTLFDFGENSIISGLDIGTPTSRP